MYELLHLKQTNNMEIEILDPTLKRACYEKRYYTMRYLPEVINCVIDAVHFFELAKIAKGIDTVLKAKTIRPDGKSGKKV